MSDNRTDLPSPSAPNFNQRLRETIQTYLGRQGNPLDRGLTLRDLIQSGIVKIRDGFTLQPGQPTLPLEPGAGVVDTYQPDLTPPPTPTGFAVSAAISHVFIEHDAPLYPQGHGHLRTRVYGVTLQAGDPLPVFNDAVEITQFTGMVHAHPSNPATTWRLWIKWETVDGVLSSDPAGGTNGLEVTTGQDVALLLEALTGQITESQLYQDLTTRLDGIESNAAAIQTEASTRTTETGNLFAQYTVKIDVAGHVSGYGLASTSNGATPTSQFGVRANQFFVAPPAVSQATAPMTDLYKGYVWVDTSVTPNVTKYYTGSAWSTTPQALPFIIQTAPTTINGVSVPAGVYMDTAFIRDGTITNAKIGNAAIDDAKIANLSASKITAGSIAVGDYIQSTGYIAGSAGWRINGDGNAELSNAVVRGTVYATNGEFTGTVKAGTTILGGLATAYSSGSGFYAGLDSTVYKWRVGNPTGARIQWTGSAIEVYNASNQLTISSGGISASYVSGLGTLATQNSVSTSQVTGLGTLATQSSVNWSTQITNIPAFGNFAYLNSITSANISTYIASAAIGTAYIANAAITQAQIGNAAVNTLNIAGNAVTVPSTLTVISSGIAMTKQTTPFSAWQTIGTLTVDFGSAAPSLVAVFAYINLLSVSGTGGAALYCRVVETTTGQAIPAAGVYVQSSTTISVSGALNPGAGTRSFAIQVTRDNTSQNYNIGDANITVFGAKR